MVTKKIIGFGSYNKDPDDKKEEEEKKEDCAVKMLSDFIARTYSPIGATSNKVYKTSDELAYELSEIVDIRSIQIAKALIGAGFLLQYINSKPYWVMYEKCDFKV